MLPAAASQTTMTMMIVATLALAVLQPAASCPPSSPDCVIQDLDNPVSLADVLARLTDATRRLTLRSLNLTDWPESLGGRSRVTAAQLESLELDRVGFTAATSDASSTTAGGGGQGQRLRGGSMPALRSLRLRGSCHIAGVVGFAGLQELLVADCRLGGTGLTAAWLGDLPQLRRLSVENAKVDSLHLAAVDAATRASLSDIRLPGNSLNTLTDDALGDMPSLRNLTLDGNIIQYIQLGAFAKLPSLTLLSIALPKEGQLAKIWEATLDGRFDNNAKLETLRLVNARLAEEQIPRSFDQLKQLRHLDLSGHRFRRLHNSVLSSLTALEYLDLSNGSLSCLYDRNFGIMGRLRRLNLANNDIRLIAKRSLLGLRSLVSLDLTGNPIAVIEPGAFCTLRGEIKDSPSLLSGWGLQASRIDGAANISSPCPPDFNPDRLILSSQPQCPMLKGDGGGNGKDSDGSEGKRTPEQSRHTFLIIIGLCVAFLIITVISMMAYKGWSKRKNAQLAKDEEKELELQAMVAAAASDEAGTSGAATDPAGKKPGGPGPQNGRQNRQHGHHHHRSSKDKSQAQAPSAASPTEPTAPSAASAEPKPMTMAADAAATNNATVLETTVQVESPQRGGHQEPAAPTPQSPAADKASEDPAAASASAAAKPQMRPGITLMTTVPEDSDLEARAITTLVVV